MPLVRSSSPSPDWYGGPSLHLFDFYGEVILVNGRAWHYLRVEPRPYRFQPSAGVAPAPGPPVPVGGLPGRSGVRSTQCVDRHVGDELGVGQFVEGAIDGVEAG